MPRKLLILGSREPIPDRLLGGFGLHLAIPRLIDEGAADGLYVMGTLAIGLGIGFVLSAVASLIISNRLGLFSQWPENRPDREGSAPRL